MHILAKAGGNQDGDERKVNSLQFGMLSQVSLILVEYD